MARAFLLPSAIVVLLALGACEPPCTCNGDVCSNCSGTIVTSPPPPSDAGDAGDAAGDQ